MLAIRCKKLVTVTGPVIDEGVLVIDNGKIREIGDKDTVIPEGAEVVDASDKWVYPGFIDASLRISGINGSDDSVSPQLKIIHSVDPDGKSIEAVRFSGVTTCFAAPGPGGIIDGQGAAIKLKKAESAEEMIIPGSEQMCFTLGDETLFASKMRKRPPFTRMGLADMLRDVLTKARTAAAAEEFSANRDRKIDALIPVVKGEMTARFECLKAMDITAAVNIAEEFNLEYVIVGAFEAHKVPEFLKKHKTPVILEALPYGSRCLEFADPYDVNFESAGILEKNGNLQCITINQAGPAEMLPIFAGFATAYGLSRQGALESVTIGAARQLRLEDRIGSLEVGKDADIAVFTGDALLNTSHCHMAFVEGERVY